VSWSPKGTVSLNAISSASPSDKMSGSRVAMAFPLRRMAITLPPANGAGGASVTPPTMARTVSLSAGSGLPIAREACPGFSPKLFAAQKAGLFSEEAQFRLDALETLGEEGLVDRRRRRGEHLGDLVPGEPAIDAENEQGLLSRIELLAEPGDGVLDLGAKE